MTMNDHDAKVYAEMNAAKAESVDKTQKVIETLEARLKLASKGVEEFHKRLQKNEVFAMEWSDNMFAAVATRDVCGRYLKCLKEGTATLQNVIDSATEDVLSEARHPSRSSSAVSNLMATELAKVKASFVAAIKWL
jgi:hypothetical protein